MASTTLRSLTTAAVIAGTAIASSPVAVANTPADVDANGRGLPAQTMRGFVKDSAKDQQVNPIGADGNDAGAPGGGGDAGDAGDGGSPADTDANGDSTGDAGDAGAPGGGGDAGARRRRCLVSTAGNAGGNGW